MIVKPRWLAALKITKLRNYNNANGPITISYKTSLKLGLKSSSELLPSLHWHSSEYPQPGFISLIPVHIPVNHPSDHHSSNGWGPSSFCRIRLEPKIQGLFMGTTAIFKDSMRETLTLLSRCLSPARSKWMPANCQGNLMKCWEVTCNGLASHPEGVGILLVASSYKNRGKFQQ